MPDKYAGLSDDVVHELDPGRFLDLRKPPEGSPRLSAEEALRKISDTDEDRQKRNAQREMRELYVLKDRLDETDKAALPAAEDQARKGLYEFVSGREDLNGFVLKPFEAEALVIFEEKATKFSAENPGKAFSLSEQLDAEELQIWNILLEKYALFLLNKEKDQKKIGEAKERIEELTEKLLPKDLTKWVATFLMGWGTFGDREFSDKSAEVSRKFSDLNARLYEVPDYNNPTAEQNKKVAEAYKIFRDSVIKAYGEKRGKDVLNSIATFQGIEQRLS